MSTQNQVDVFHAIGAPIRRDIIHTLALSGDLSISDIAQKHPISRQAVTRHIQVLAHSGIVQIEKVGREQICQLNADGLKEVYEWVLFYEQFWDRKLDGLVGYLKRRAESKT